jgi:hypothetical protein
MEILQRKYSLFLLLLFFLLLALCCGCTPRSMIATPYIDNELKPKAVRTVYEFKPVNLQAGSRCLAATTVNVVNVEKNNQDTIIFENFHTICTVKPKILSQMVADYMKEALQFSHIKVDQTSSRKILLSLPKTEMFNASSMVSSKGGTAQLKVEIPEIEFSKVYNAEEWTGKSAFAALAYALHKTVWECINDPEVQAYLQCR